MQAVWEFPAYNDVSGTTTQPRGLNALAKTILLLLFMALPATVQAQFRFITNNGAITITRYTGTDSTVVIPSATNGYPVTSIGDNAFNQKSSRLTSVTIPNSITSIGSNAFYGSGLTNITIPNSVTNIGDSAFQSCSSLTNFTVDGLNTFYSSTNGVLFDKNQTVLIQYPPGKWGDYIIPDSITNIGDAFASCRSLTSVTIPNSVTSIGSHAFSSCSSLTNVTIPSSITRIGDSAFQHCSSLASLTIPNSVTNIGSWVFESCTSLSNITIPNSITSIGSYAFYYCFSLNSITIPNSVTSIGNDAFYGCSSLTSVIVPNSVTNIASELFYRCFDLTSVTIPNSVTSIGSYAFYSCSSLTNVTIPSSVTNIGNSAFQGCSSLTNFTVDAQNAFYSSTNGVLFDKNQTVLILYPPGGKSGEYTIPNSVTNVGSGAFYGCSGLTNITIPNSVTSIGDDSFFSCTSLTSVTIPNSVTSIGFGAFEGCLSLTGIYFLGDAPSTVWDAFDESGLATIYFLPGTSGWSPYMGNYPWGLWTALWNPQVQTTDGSFGLQSNQFGFNITGTTNIPIVVEACTNLTGGVWVPLQSVSLTNGSFYFGDQQWTNYPDRYYRIRSP